MDFTKSNNQIVCIHIQALPLCVLIVGIPLLVNVKVFDNQRNDYMLYIQSNIKHCLKR